MKETRSKKRKKRFPLIKLTVVIVLIGILGFILKLNFLRDDIEKVTVTTPEEVKQVRIPEDSIKKDSFSILLLGIDTGEFGRIEQGRSDTIIVATINKKENKLTFVSIPRDSYVEIIGYDTYDKINHSYAFGGVAMTINTIQAYLDIPIDFFVTLNMQGLEQIVDSIGGITLTPTATFTQNGYSFYQGEIINLDGEASLAYSRNRHADDSGDYGRQARQREVIMAIIEKGTKVTTIATKIPSLIRSLQGNMTTNMSVDDMWTIINKYSNALRNIEQVQLKGEGQLLDDGIYYEMINEESLEEVQNILQKQLDYHLNID